MKTPAKVLLFLVCAVSVNAWAGINLVAYEIPTLTQTDGGGSYDKILGKMKSIAGESWEYQVMPPARADNAFKSGKADCIGPLDIDFYEGGGVVQTDYFNIAKIYIYTPKGSPALTQPGQLKGMSVGARKSMPYGPEFNSAGLDVSYAGSIETNLKKLDAGRLDAFVAYVPDAWFVPGVNSLSHDKENPMAVHEDGFTCRDTPEARAFIKQFNAALNELNEVGEVRQILGDTYVTP